MLTQKPYSLPLKHDHLVSQQVVKLQLASLLDHVGMFAHEQPANVGKEEAAHGVVRVGVRLRVLVVDPVVAGPLVDVVLPGTRVQMF